LNFIIRGQTALTKFFAKILEKIKTIEDYIFKYVKKTDIITDHLGINDLWQADLAEMGAFSKSNDGYLYLLTVIDTFSKYAWGEALKEKK